MGLVLPVYFQGVLGSSPSHSGIQLMPTVLILIPLATTGGALLSKFSRYRPIHHVGFALIVIGSGLLSLLDTNSSTSTSIGFQIIESANAGPIIPTLLPAVMAPLAKSDTALETGTWTFLCSFGLTWGTTIQAAVFNSRFDELETKYGIEKKETSSRGTALKEGEGTEMKGL